MALQQTYNPQNAAGASILQPTYNPQTTVGSNLNTGYGGGISLGSPNSNAPAGQPLFQPPSYSTPGPVYAPKLDLSGIYGKAQGIAQNNVNPYYTKQLNDFIAQQSAEKVSQQQQAQTNIQNLQDQAANTLKANALTQQRTGQDVLQNEQQAGIKFDQQQQDQGTQFDQARIAQAKQLATQGVTTSGVGAQQVLQGQNDRNLQEGRQTDEFHAQNQTQELFKSRTFADLAQSNVLAQQSKDKGVKQINFDLNKYIQNQGFALSNEKGDLEQQRLARVAQETNNQAKLLVNQFIQNLSNPAQRLAAAQQYGSAF